MGIFRRSSKEKVADTNMNSPVSKRREKNSEKTQEDVSILGIQTDENEKQGLKQEESKPKKEIKIEDIEKVNQNDQGDSQDVVDKYTGMNFAKLSKEKMFSVISELLVHVKTLENNLKKYDSESDGIYEDYKKKNSSLKYIRKSVEGLARKISPSFNERVSKTQDHDLDTTEIIEMINSDYLNEKRKYQKRIVELEKQKYQDKRLLDSLKKQMTKMVDGEVNIKSEDGNTEFSEDDIKNHNNDEGSDDVKIIAVSVKEAREAMTETEYNILGVMGKEGYSLFPEIEEQLISRYGYTESKIKTSIQRLEEHNLLKSETVKTPKIRRGVRVLEINKEVGNSLYEEKFGEKPVESEKERIIKDHDNLEHGYSIVEASKILEHQLGYLDVSHDRNKNTISVGGNKKWVPDIVALNPVSNKKEYFEVEFGNHTQENFEEKMNKATLKAKVLRFIVPNAIKREKLKSKINAWRAKGDNKKSKMTISIGTVNDLEDKEYGVVIE